MSRPDLKRSQSSQQVREHYTFVDYDYLIKVVVVGDSGVGKSQLVARFTRNEFSDHCRQTIGVEFATKTIYVEGRAICSQIWDTAGEERYRALASAYYRGAIGVLLVYDVSSPTSYKNLTHWLSEIKAYTLPSCQIVLVANKIDLRRSRKVEQESGKAFAEEHGITYIEASALESTNVEEAFTSLIEDIYKNTILSRTANNLYPKNDPGNETRKLQGRNNDSQGKDQLLAKCCS